MQDLVCNQEGAVGFVLGCCVLMNNKYCEIPPRLGRRT